MCDPIIVNPVVKMRPHPAAHPLLASYKEVPHPPAGWEMLTQTNILQVQ